ncbi:hypothetical protein, partial [Pseudochrobactrum sp. AO18b]|uniref:hypothetical protein n=1 Tax=Pseudochrobactrum sp. AO18b TaxID=1201036 RepID=UPI001AEC69B1
RRTLTPIRWSATPVRDERRLISGVAGVGHDLLIHAAQYHSLLYIAHRRLRKNLRNIELPQVRSKVLPVHTGQVNEKTANNLDMWNHSTIIRLI